MAYKTIIAGLLTPTLLAFALTGLLSPIANAGFPFAGKCLSQTGCSLCCPVCDHTCRLDAKEVEEEISCFEVESKVICIPRVVFPWQKKRCQACDTCDGGGCTDCVHNGARIRRVCVLKKDKIKCPKCKYTWTPEKKCNACDRGCEAYLDQHEPIIATPSPKSPIDHQPAQTRRSGILTATPVRTMPPTVHPD